MTRPADLPEYENPPINEVVLGVQFAPPHGYQQIYVGEVWKLYKDKFPTVEERDALPPTLESFGAPQIGHIKFGLMSGPSHDRFWFLSKNKSELIQFQNDRFLHNWRKIGDGSNDYVRFDSMIKEYESELKSLQKYLAGFGVESLNINQCELTYISHIPLEEGGKQGSKFDDWLNIINLSTFASDDSSLALRKVIRNQDGHPFAALSCEAVTALGKKDKRMIALNITFRGLPANPSIDGALSFLKNGRIEIVNCFDQISTGFAHKIWKRT